MMRHIVLILSLAVWFGACKAGPNYRRPAVPVPGEFRSPTPPTPLPPDASTLGDLHWWEVFQDPELQLLLRKALDNNYDIRVAAARVEQAAANVGVVRADQFPQAVGTVEFSRTKRSGAAVPFIPGFAGITNTVFGITPAVSWALDFWGEFRRATEAARAGLLATEAGREAVRSSIVAAVATAYFQLRELDLELEITNRTLETRLDSLRLTRLREEGGVVSMLDVRQSESLVTTAMATIPQLKQQIEQTENLISTLLGEAPQEIRRGLPLDRQIIPAAPPGLPSALLARRPDIRAAEQVLVAANARIGVARAAYFPNITIDAFTGFETAGIENTFTRQSWVWGFIPSLRVPLFTGGRIKSTVELSEAQRQEAIVAYQQTIQQAVREVSDALFALTRIREFRLRQEALTAIYRDAARLSQVRYRGGVTTYLEVLDSERNVYAAELNLAQARLNELTATIQLYSALGGGWQQ